MPNKLFLIDGHALIFKTYYALLNRPMVNSKGQDTSILYGFTKYLLELIEKKEPTHLAVVFDPPGGTFRNKMFTQYKANRPPTPQLIIDALEPLTEICGAMRIPALTIMGYEADDVIGTLAKKFGNEQTEVYMITPDKDYGQLVDPHIFQIKPGRAGSPDELFGEEQICEKYGIAHTGQIIDMLTLCGDTADNVPGVDGIGEKTAAKLLAKYGDVQNIYSHLDELSAKQKEKFEKAEDHIELSHELVTIKTDVPVDICLRDMVTETLDNPKLFELFDFYEFHSLKKHIKGAAQLERQQETEFNVSHKEAASFIRLAKATGRIALHLEGDQLFSEPGKITLALEDSGTHQLFSSEGQVQDFKSILEDEAIGKAGYNLKLQLNILAHAGITLSGKLYDIELMHYLMNPEQSSKIEILSSSLLGINLDSMEEQETVQLSLFDAPEALPEKDNSKETAISYLLSKVLEEKIESMEVSKLYWEMEEPLIRVLARMERNGVKVNLAQLDDYAKELRKEMLEREARIREMADEPQLNISSPKQIGTVLFEKLALDPKAKKSSKGNWSTDEPTLKAIEHTHPIIHEILEFRAVKKLLSTYIEPFGTYISPVTGRIHTTFNQALTSTGRLSSSNPNLQNIPVRTERGKEIRKAFIPDNPDNLILSADYSQIELRIMAHLSGDAHLIQSFKDGIDVHAATASKIFKIPYDEVTPDERRIAKTANFGIMYGISAFGLSQRLDMPVGKAKKFIEDYFEAFPAIQYFIKDTISYATANGYVETIFGRRRYIPELQSKNGTVRALGERNAVNAPIQGTSADIIKLAMIGVDRRMREEKLQSKMILQIHDELLFDTRPEEAEILKKIVKEEMENVITLSVPLTIDCNYGKNWLEAH